MKRPFIRAFREKRWTGATEITLGIGDREFSLTWLWRDNSHKGSRAYLILGYRHGNDNRSILFQHYREGFEFETHTDGIKHNRILTVLLHRPKLGGEFYAEGPIQRWLNGRLVVFDGGQQPHGVTKIENGSRTVVMFQHGRWR